MKILGFVGSPRKKGNTDIMVDTFLNGAASAGATVQKYFLAGLNINQCMGCYRNCMLEEGFRCKIFRDDMDMLLREMATADIMLFASPLYCATYTAIMARFLERCLPLWQAEIVGEPGTMDAIKIHKNPVKGKDAVLGMVHDLKDPRVAELAFKAFEHNIGAIYMMNVIDRIHVPDVRDIGDIEKKTAELEKISALGKRLAQKK